MESLGKEISVPGGGGKTVLAKKKKKKGDICARNIFTKGEGGIGLEHGVEREKGGQKTTFAPEELAAGKGGKGGIQKDEWTVYVAPIRAEGERLLYWSLTRGKRQTWKGKKK